GSVAAGAIRKWGRTARPGGCGAPRNAPGPTLGEGSVCRSRTCVPRKAAAGAERSSREPGHASLAGLAGRQLAAGTWRPVPAHKSVVGPWEVDAAPIRGRDGLKSLRRRAADLRSRVDGAF